MKKAQIKVLFTLLTVVSCLVLSCNTNGNTEQPLNHEREEHNPDKTAIWTPEQAARHQQILVKLVEKSKNFTKKEFARTAQNTTYANGALTGDWTNRGPKNMPGAFKFAEMLDGTDVIYGVSHNHYAGEFNSKSYIFKGGINICFYKITQSDARKS